MLKLIEEGLFDSYTYTRGEPLSADSSIVIFICDQDSDFNIRAYPGNEDEHFWVEFINDVGVIASADSLKQNFGRDDEPTLLNIDAAGEILFEYLDWEESI